jgi:hypothetical protein
MAVMNLLQSVVCYSDLTIQTVNNNPFLQNANWARNYYGITVNNPASQQYTVPPNSSVTLFNGTRSLGLSNTSTVSITNTTGSTYRISDATGASAAYRTNRNIAVDQTTGWTISTNNGLVTMTSLTGTSPSLGSVVAGDQIYIGPNTNFNVLNQGYYSIVSSTTNSLSIVNQNAIPETQTVGTSATVNFQVFSSAGVQTGDTLVLSAGFSPVTFGNYIVSNVASNFVEFTSTNPLPLQSSVTPTSSGLIIYSSAIRVLYIEVNQNCVLQLNADTSNNNLIQPFTFDTPGVPESGLKGLYLKVGSIYQATLINQSLLNPCELYTFTAQ